MAEGPDTATPAPAPEPPYRLIPLDDTSFEYKEVWGAAMRTAARDLSHFFDHPVRITDIKRVENVLLWERFCAKRALEMRRGSSAWVRELFHGVKGANVDSICRGDANGERATHQGDESMAKVVPFSPYFWYARRFPRRSPKGTRTMLMCDVLVYNQRDEFGECLVINKFEHEFYPKYVMEYSIPVTSINLPSRYAAF